MISFRMIFLNIHSGLSFSGIQMKRLYAFLTCFMHATYAVHLIILIIFTQKYIHLVVCLMTGPKPLPKPALHIVRSRASSFKWEYPLLSLTSSSSFLHLLPCLPVTSIPSFIFPSITRRRKQFLRKMWPIQFAFRLRISCRIFLCSLTLSNTSSFLTWSVQLIFSILLNTTFQNFPGVSDLLPETSKFQHHIKLCFKYSTSHALREYTERFLPNFKTRYSVDGPEVLISYAFFVSMSVHHGSRV